MKKTYNTQKGKSVLCGTMAGIVFGLSVLGFTGCTVDKQETSNIMQEKAKAEYDERISAIKQALTTNLEYTSVKYIEERREFLIDTEYNIFDVVEDENGYKHCVIVKTLGNFYYTISVEEAQKEGLIETLAMNCETGYSIVLAHK